MADGDGLGGLRRCARRCGVTSGGLGLVVQEKREARYATLQGLCFGCKLKKRTPVLACAYHSKERERTQGHCTRTSPQANLGTESRYLALKPSKSTSLLVLMSRLHEHRTAQTCLSVYTPVAPRESRYHGSFPAQARGLRVLGRKRILLNSWLSLLMFDSGNAHVSFSVNCRLMVRKGTGPWMSQTRPGS